MTTSTTTQHTLRLRTTEEERALLGGQDRTLRLLRRYLGVRAFARRGLVTVQGPVEAVQEAIDLLEGMVRRIRAGENVSGDELETHLRRARERREDDGGVDVATEGRVLRALDDTVIRPKSEAQARYVRAVETHDIVFSVGPAGTGKTYLAVAMAIRMMKRGLFRKLVLVRPAVEAGEHLGFLPGDLNAKVSPYLRPLYDALGDFLEFSEIRRFEERDIIEVVPLAYMRGRTLDNAFIILDEGQNTSPGQMKMFLTRMGRRSKIVVTGDITQTDLPKGKQSGLIDARDRLGDVRGIAFCRLGREDIVRHPLVQLIVDAYDSPGMAGADPSGVDGVGVGGDRVGLDRVGSERGDVVSADDDPSGAGEAPVPA